MNVRIEEYDLVAITEDIPREAALRGDVGVIVHCYPGHEAFEVEVQDAQGKPKSVVTTTAKQLLRLRLNLKSLVA